MKQTKLTNKDYTAYYKYSLFGDIENNLEASIKRAYRDFNRTISKFGKHEKHDEIFEKAKSILGEEILKLNSSTIEKQDDFDVWHKNCCDKLKSAFENQEFHYGQAQKWINMTLKYYSVLDYEKCKKTYEFYHIPIDKKILRTGEFKIKTWSKIDDYKEYLEFQKEFREKYKKEIPLDVEFKLWLKKEDKELVKR